MKIYGELEEAVLERLGSNPSGPVGGRFWFDTSDNTFKFYDGSVVRSYASLENLVDDLNTLSGVAAGATNMGAFTGTVLTDNTTIKANIQELGTQVDTNTSNIAGNTGTPGSAYLTSTTSYTTPGGAVWDEIGTTTTHVTISKWRSASKVEINFIDHEIVSPTTNLGYRIKRGATVIKTYSNIFNSSGDLTSPSLVTGGLLAEAGTNKWMEFKYIDTTTSTGSLTYTIEWRASTGSYSSNARSLIVKEI